MIDFEDYIRNFNYQAIPKMKITSEDLLDLILAKEKVQIIDILFREEFEMWNFSFMKNIPINELPDRLDELDKDVLVVVACPRNDRSNIAMHYLKTKGYNVKFLYDGLLSMPSHLLGGAAKKYYSILNK